MDQNEYNIYEGDNLSDDDKTSLVSDMIDPALGDYNNIEYPSATERFLATKVAPELLSDNGRISVIVIWTIITIVAALGIPNLDIEFDISYFIDETKYIYSYFEMLDTYFETGFNV